MNWWLNVHRFFLSFITKNEIIITRKMNLKDPRSKDSSIWDCRSQISRFEARTAQTERGREG